MSGGHANAEGRTCASDGGGEWQVEQKGMGVWEESNGRDVSKGKAALGLTWGSEEALGIPGAIQWLDSCAVVASGLSRLSLYLCPSPATD